VPQKRLAEEVVTIPAHRQRLETPFLQLFLRKRLQYMLDDSLPWPPLMSLVPVGLLAVVKGRRWVLWAYVPLLALGYTFHATYLSFYAVAVAPAVIYAVLAGVSALGSVCRARFGGIAIIVLTAVILTVAVVELPEFGGGRRDDFEGAQVLREVDHELAKVEGTPSLVLIRFGAGCNPSLEPVYNADVAWPDDAGVIRAHDLGDEVNGRLFAYYAGRDPGRRVYRYDRAAAAGSRVVYLGTVGELAAGARSSSAAWKNP
jgi:hypothetical protein